MQLSCSKRIDLLTFVLSHISPYLVMAPKGEPFRSFGQQRQGFTTRFLGRVVGSHVSKITICPNVNPGSKQNPWLILIGVPVSNSFWWGFRPLLEGTLPLRMGRVY